jgi:hypothetical protein
MELFLEVFTGYLPMALLLPVTLLPRSIRIQSYLLALGVVGLAIYYSTLLFVLAY